MTCRAQEAKTYYQSAGTKEMAELLQKIYREQDIKTDPSKDGERATKLRIELAGTASLGPELKLRYSLAEALLRSGDSAGAIQELERVRSECQKNFLRLDPYSEQHLRDTLALSYLRLGEQQNCSLHHNEHSCIFPLESTGIHTDKTGAQGAVRELIASLKADPNNVQSRWLLNLAYMQIGEYPSGVPAQWVASPHLFDSEYDIGRFPDVAPRAGIERHGARGWSRNGGLRWRRTA